MAEKIHQKAVALHYDLLAPPRVIAAGSGETARLIAEAARRAGKPLVEDAVLAEALLQVELDQSIPEDLFVAVAVVLAWAYWIEGKAPPDTQQ